MNLKYNIEKIVRRLAKARHANSNGKPPNTETGRGGIDTGSDEREYWLAMLTNWFRDRYDLALDPAQSDPSIVPPAAVVEVTQPSQIATVNGFFGSGYRVALNYLTELSDHGYNPNAMGRILEFGVGFGRLMVHHLPFKADLYGVDATESALAWTRKTLGPRVTLELTGLQPPLPFPSNHFDYIYAQSVFTHIPAEMVRPWAVELARVTRPNGVVIASFFDPNVYFADHTNWEFNKKFESVGCVSWEVEKGVRMTTFVSREALVDIWSAAFTILELRGHFRDQWHIILRKR